jgi:hypothetical protein
MIIDTDYLIKQLKYWGFVFGALGLVLHHIRQKTTLSRTFTHRNRLIVFPCFVSNLYVLVITGVVLTILPYFFTI